MYRTIEDGSRSGAFYYDSYLGPNDWARRCLPFWERYPLDTKYKVILLLCICARPHTANEIATCDAAAATVPRFGLMAKNVVCRFCAPMHEQHDVWPGMISIFRQDACRELYRFHSLPNPD